MNTQVVTITPEWAQEILRQNVHNRHVRRSLVDKYAYAIKTNQFPLTHQGIAIGSNGVLLDGQHRLLAVLKTGIPLQTLLCTNCDPATFTVLDSGATRKSADVLRIENVPSANTAAAAIRLYILYHDRIDKIWNGRVRVPTNDEIFDYYKSREDEINYAVQKCTSVRKTFRQLTNASSIATFVLLALDKKHSETHIELFLQKLGNGTNLEETCPILRFRTAVFNGLLQSRGGNVPQLTLASIIKTFNFWHDQNTMKQFKLPNIPPMPLIQLANAKIEMEAGN